MLDEQAAQCGFCVSGVIMSAAALLRATPHPDERAVVEALDRNLCRCGAHAPDGRGRCCGRRRADPAVTPAAGAARRTCAANPLLARWIRGRVPDGTVDVRVGKVELGQGILTALAQLAADELDLPTSPGPDARREHRASARTRA